MFSFASVEREILGCLVYVTYSICCDVLCMYMLSCACICGGGVLIETCSIAGIGLSVWTQPVQECFLIHTIQHKIIWFLYIFTGRRNFNEWDTFQYTWLVDIFHLDQKMCVGPFQYKIVSYQFSKTTVETRQSYHCFISTKWFPLWQDSNFILLKWAPNLLKSLSLWVSRHQTGYV